jgi:hypothetical protein
MDRQAIIAAIDEELAKLERARKLLTTSNSDKLLKSSPAGKPARKKRVLSAEARERIAAAQKKRWAKHRRQGNAAKK